uniref:Isoform D of Putative gustatory receptor 28b n=1 Tax=Drosophila melanogaster TaxID=7227 RepID=Q9VM08-4|nr:gustatory receptor 28b, isoform D [Drosophila melanogaster]AAS64650.1 gustatory receptor 28b, isoform D [Drosophila melanogaster]|eukprot:NP_995641.1 gustatory receptor 28b, isoform D [Drosophila melanogaster]
MSFYFCEIFKPRDAFGAEQTLLLYTYLLGLTPFRLRGQAGERQFHLSKIGYLNAFLQLSFFSYCFLAALIEQQSIVGYFFKSEISQMGDSLQKFIGMTGMSILFLCSSIRVRLLIHIWDRISYIDDRFLNLGVCFNYPAIMRLRLLQIFLINGVQLGYLISSNWMLLGNDVRPIYTAIVAFYVPQIFLLSIVMLFNATLHRLWQHFTVLNQVLKNLAHQWDTRSLKAVNQKQRSLQCLDSFSMYTIVTKDPAEIIQESMEIHHLICEAAATANKYFTYQLLTIISIAFLIIVFDAYYVLETLLGKSKRESKFKTVEFVTFFSCQMILYLIAIISIVEGSNRAIKKSEKTGGIVHSLLNKTKSAEVKEKLQQFSMQLMHLKINFTAAGLFNIDRTLYFTISGALTTYLIILLQFTSNSPNNGYGNGSSCCETFNNMTNHTL